MIRIVCDINILVSGTYWTGEAHKILDKVDKREIENVISHEIVLDYVETCDSGEIIEKINKHHLKALRTKEKITAMSILVHPKIKLIVVKDDPDDDKIINAAVEGKADYIISYDNHLLKIKDYKGIKILTPKEFLEVLNKKN